MQARRTLISLGALLAGTAALAAAAPVAALNLLSALPSRQVASGRRYGPLPRQHYDLYRPAGLPPAGGWPLVVFFYGGSWRSGERADYRFVGEALAAQGCSPQALAGWIGLAGPYDFLPIRTLAVQPVFGHPDVPADSQPIRHAAHSRLPALLLAAQDDDLVNPQRNSAQLAALLRAADAPVQWQAFDGVSHTSLLAALAWPLRRLAPVLAAVTGFVAAVQGPAA